MEAAGSAAALFAGSLLLRKTFEAVAQRSLSSIFTRLHARFRGQHQLQILQRELESRLQVLSLPVDMCVQYVLHGNTALQGALDMVLLVINDIISFQEELEAQAYNESITKLSQSEAAKRLEGFLSRLDAILPYLALAVNAVSLLKITDPGLSPSRLMEASHMIRCERSQKGVVMSITAKLHKFETRLTLPRWQEKMLACSVTLRRIPDASASAASGFELAITNEGSDSADEEATIRFSVDEIAAIGSSTLHVLGLGEHDLEAVLLLDIIPSAAENPSCCNNEVQPVTPLQGPYRNMLHYALQCIEDDCLELREDAEAKNTNGENESDVEESDEDATCKEGSIVGFTSRISKLGILEYALRLCMLQAREEKDHWVLSDERIRMFFGDPRYASVPAAYVPKPQSGGRTDSGKLTPIQRKKTQSGSCTHAPYGPSASVPRRSARRLSITEMFYALQLDSPTAGKPQGSQANP